MTFDRRINHLVEQTGTNPIKTLQEKLDAAVCAAYGFDPSGDVLQQPLDLNHSVASKEKKEKRSQHQDSLILKKILQNPSQMIV